MGYEGRKKSVKKQENLGKLRFPDTPISSPRKMAAMKRIFPLIFFNYVLLMLMKQVVQSIREKTWRKP